MKTNTEARQWLYGLAAAQLVRGERKGKAPSLVEIDQWRLGRLQASRATEVLSHIAHDEQCFAQWRELCAEQHWLDAQPSDEVLQDQPLAGQRSAAAQPTARIGNVLAKLSTPGWGGALAAGLFALLVLPMVLLPGEQNFGDAYLQQLSSANAASIGELPPVLMRTTKAIQALDISSENTDKRQFQWGLAAAAARVAPLDDDRWQSWREALPEAPDCAGRDDGDCSNAALRNQALGSWSLVTSLACHHPDTAQSFWAEQAEALSQLAEGGLSAEHFLSARLQAPLPTGRASLCLLANGLLGQGG